MKRRKFLEVFTFMLVFSLAMPAWAQVQHPPQMGTIGLKCSNKKPELDAQYKLDPKQEGLVVIEVVPGTTGEAAGFKPGDLIIMINKKVIHNLQEFMDERMRYKIGESLELTFIRGKQKLTKKLKIQATK